MKQRKIPDERVEAVMRKLMQEAKHAREAGEVPVAAAVLDSEGEIVSLTQNRRERDGSPLAHAEVLAIEEVARLAGGWNLSEYTLVVTLEPCLLCAAAIQAARISRVVYGAWDEKAGAVGSVYDILRDRRLPFRTEVISGVLPEENRQILQEFFHTKRSNHQERM